MGSRIPACCSAAALLLAGASCSGSSTAPSPGTPLVVVKGQVIDYLSNAGVPAANVRLGDYRAVTDQAGGFILTIPPGGYPVTADGEIFNALVYGVSYRGDFLVHAGGCNAFSGVVMDARTYRPVPNAAVHAGKTKLTEADGWYRIDVNCGKFGIGTTFMTVSHPAYQDYSRLLGRAEAIAGLYRVDLLLEPR